MIGWKFGTILRSGKWVVMFVAWGATTEHVTYLRALILDEPADAWQSKGSVGVFTSGAWKVVE